MFGDLFTGPHLIIVLVVIVLLFGATKLPALAKAAGQSARIFRTEVKGMKDDDAKTDSTAKSDASSVSASVSSDAAAGPVSESQPKP
ncbi:MAG TPA: twin-arginine translocase TatA/TatE family subunit [Galbitalea sp.]|jgi:sec-independent protein translocase protein TatA|nr:twin-arginine translocase TatA/TatE family subunit [Galbitalea sp.]